MYEIKTRQRFSMHLSQINLSTIDIYLPSSFKVGSISNSTATFFCTIFKVSSAIITPYKRTIYADAKSS